VSSSERERFEVILESIETKIGGLADGHLALNEKLDRLEGKVDHLANDVTTLRMDLGSVKHRVGKIEHRVGKIEHHLGLNGVATARTTKSTIKKPERGKPR
jgi:outer membrane murein-binding lipoprotein Lpp